METLDSRTTPAQEINLEDVETIRSRIAAEAILNHLAQQYGEDDGTVIRGGIGE